ncbi:hypothetical protein KFE25_002170 [Diacronema lutheri]|uniref:Methyltransferase domain-containing protein n=1 Tax=Diacronema lutheri TaxID=2081491 RepID=A0A8J5XTT0_DIALT|nr:hypothetical protein KFE25_002170 [Diacronema lutheri]
MFRSVVALAARRRPLRRALSGAPAPPAFDGDAAELYAKMFAQHAHPDGPWRIMVDAARGALGPSRAGNVLDLASGPGEPGITIAKLLPDARVVCTDISVDMVNKARARAAGLPNVRFEVVDAQDLSPFADGEFDAITCCYGAMFFPEPARALREARRVLRPGGLLVATYWLRMPMVDANRVAMEAVLKAPQPPPEINPLSLQPDGLFEGLLADAGFDVTRTNDSAYPLELGTLDAVFRLVLVPVWDKLKALHDERAQSGEDVLGTARAALERFFAARGYTQPDGRIVLHGNMFRMAVARAV